MPSKHIDRQTGNTERERERENENIGMNERSYSKEFIIL